MSGTYERRSNLRECLLQGIFMAHSVLLFIHFSIAYERLLVEFLSSRQQPEQPRNNSIPLLVPPKTAFLLGAGSQASELIHTTAAAQAH